MEGGCVCSVLILPTRMLPGDIHVTSPNTRKLLMWTILSIDARESSNDYATLSGNIMIYIILTSLALIQSALVDNPQGPSTIYLHGR